MAKMTIEGSFVALIALPGGAETGRRRDGEDEDGADAVLLRLLPLLHFTYSAINPVPVKSLMKALGLPAGDLRRPLRALEGGALASGHAGDERRDPDRS